MRLRRADYPTATSQNIFNRMKSEREREAKEFRATGEEEAQKIRADAEKTRTVIISEAQREAQQTRGEGDGEAIKIYADSFGQDAEFFAFYRSMEAYRKSMATATPRWSCRPTAASSASSRTRAATGRNKHIPAMFWSRNVAFIQAGGGGIRCPRHSFSRCSEEI